MLKIIQKIVKKYIILQLFKPSFRQYFLPQSHNLTRRGLKPLILKEGDSLFNIELKHGDNGSVVAAVNSIQTVIGLSLDFAFLTEYSIGPAGHSRSSILIIIDVHFIRWWEVYLSFLKIWKELILELLLVAQLLDVEHLLVVDFLLVVGGLVQHEFLILFVLYLQPIVHIPQ